ncbi:polygalacturonase-1 non-catalytic subunit beta-like isoform X2 [Rhodamnia argentea]|uniref:Polygalacturonase-1 non-catalytic subunit beta-like isoform X2 n=1 Tax=Rhodamnia argentea TaxID=178133 RepID=A0A8B8MM19_9MYRT|nr:polygalacturonase-1 non-catalytic subunit beta-like isoform X2 [Rhodamnia argentea]
MLEYIVVSTTARTTIDANSLAGDANSIPTKEYLVRYWNEQITNNLAIPPLLTSKVSPLTTAETTLFTQLAAQDAISDHLRSFCKAAQLLCFPDLSSYQLGKDDRFFYDVINGATTLAGGMNVNESVEPGKFFRELILRSGNVIRMPDLQLKTPKRSFLPRSISSGLPFSTSKLAELKQIFHAGDDSTLEKIMVRTLSLCEKAPIQGETKRCVSSVEDMIDFATSILGHDIKLHSTESAGGSKRDILIGRVKRIDGSRSGAPVACHDSLFPYMVYNCHAVPTLHVYEADILDPVSKATINHGVAVCHMDTSAWSPNHEAFRALGSGPGRIEACHWIYGDYAVWTGANL